MAKSEWSTNIIISILIIESVGDNAYHEQERPVAGATAGLPNKLAQAVAKITRLMNTVIIHRIDWAL